MQYTHTDRLGIQTEFSVVPGCGENERAAWSGSCSWYYCSLWKNVLLWAQESIKFSTEGERRSKQNKCEVEKEDYGVKRRSDRMSAKGGKMKKIIHFPLVLHWCLKSCFAAAVSLSFSSTLLLSHRQHTLTLCFPARARCFVVWPWIEITSDLDRIHPGVSLCAEEHVRERQMKEFHDSVRCS